MFILIFKSCLPPPHTLLIYFSYYYGKFNEFWHARLKFTAKQEREQVARQINTINFGKWQPAREHANMWFLSTTLSALCIQMTSMLITALICLLKALRVPAAQSTDSSLQFDCRFFEIITWHFFKHFQIQASYKSRLAVPPFRELVRLNRVHYGAGPYKALLTKALTLTWARPVGADFHGNLPVLFWRCGASS